MSSSFGVPNTVTRGTQLIRASVRERVRVEDEDATEEAEGDERDELGASNNGWSWVSTMVMVASLLTGMSSAGSVSTHEVGVSVLLRAESGAGGGGTQFGLTRCKIPSAGMMICASRRRGDGDAGGDSCEVDALGSGCCGQTGEPLGRL